MFDWNRFDRLFDEMFSRKMGFDITNSGWDKKSYTSPDGSYSYTIMSKGFSPRNQNDEIVMLEKKLELAVEEQNFEEAVTLRDKIKDLKENGEKIKELEDKLQECIDKQDFESAIEYRDKLKKLKS